jgi:hypothetical protein
MKLKFRLLFFLVLCLMTLNVGCNDKSKYYISEKLIQSISEEDSSFPSKYNGIIFFGKCTNDEIMVLDIKQIRDIYLSDYSHLEYKSYISELFNQQLTLNFDLGYPKYVLSTEVKYNYRNLNFESFINMYCIKTNNSNFVLKNNSNNEINKTTVLYYLFLNNYLTIFDEHTGIYVVTKFN